MIDNIDEKPHTIFFEMEKNKGEKVVLSEMHFNVYTGLDLRLNWRKANGAFGLTRKGIRLNPSQWRELLPEIERAIFAMEGIVKPTVDAPKVKPQRKAPKEKAPRSPKPVYLKCRDGKLFAI